MKTHFLRFLVLVAMIGLSACDSAEPDEQGPGEEELITRVVLTFVSSSETVTFTANDPDGDGSGLQIEPIVLDAEAAYTGSIGVFNDIEGEDITEEIEEEADEHQFFFTVGGGTNGRLTVEATDHDENNLPVGLSFAATTTAGQTATGTLRIILSHFDDAPKDGVTMSDETDIDITFPVTINQ